MMTWITLPASWLKFCLLFVAFHPLLLISQNQHQDSLEQYKIGVQATLDSLSRSGRIYIEPFHHGTLEVGVYAPIGSDQQKPHDKDEVYVVISGEGHFFCNGKSMSFMPGDVLFVPAHAEHRFTEFSKDFRAWVFFYGPSGGEAGKP